MSFLAFWGVPYSCISGRSWCKEYSFCGCHACTTGTGLTLNNVSYTNNSVVTITDIGTDSAALICTTTLPGCCSSDNQETQWYLPNGTQLPNDNTQPYYRSRSQSPGAVRLHRNPGATTTGVFRCDIPDANGDLQSIYVGIYTATTGMSCRFTQHIFISVRALILKLSPSAFAAIMNRLLTLPCHSVMNQHFRSANACSEPKSPSLLEIDKWTPAKWE